MDELLRIFQSCQIVLTKMVKDGRVFGDFTLRDDQDHYLDVIPSQLWAGNENKTVKITNTFEFLEGNKGIKELTLIPLSFGTNEDGSQKWGMVSVPITNSLNSPLRLQQSKVGVVVIDKIDLNDQNIKITYHSDGALKNVHFVFLDENDQELNRAGLKVIDMGETFDRQSGQRIKTYNFENSSAEKITQIKRIGLITFDTKLNTEEQIVIPLQ